MRAAAVMVAVVSARSVRSCSGSADRERATHRYSIIRSWRDDRPLTMAILSIAWVKKVLIFVPLKPLLVAMASRNYRCSSKGGKE